MPGPPSSFIQPHQLEPSRENCATDAITPRVGGHPVRGGAEERLPVETKYFDYRDGAGRLLAP